MSVLACAGADVNRGDSLGQTALMFAATGGEGAMESVKALLSAGAFINVTNAYQRNALQSHTYYIRPPNKRISALLYAAGEIMTSPRPRCLQFRKEKSHLKHICREAIRKHLLKLDPHRHLFGRVPRLGLPATLTSYLLYHTSLAAGAEDGDDGDGDEEGDEEDREEQQEEEGGEQGMERLIRENPQILADALNHQCRTQ